MSDQKSNLTRAELARLVWAEIGTSRAAAAELVESILKQICQALSRSEQVSIARFGTFQIKEKGARPGRNPKTGEEVVIPPRRVLTFKASEQVRHRINRGSAASGDPSISRTLLSFGQSRAVPPDDGAADLIR